MFSTTGSIPSAGSILSSYTSFAASAMVAKTVLRELDSLTRQLIPSPIRHKIIEYLSTLLNRPSTKKMMMTITIEKNSGVYVNEVFAASEVYLGTRITPSNTRLKASKTPRDAQISISIDGGESIVDHFDGIELVWRLITTTNAENQTRSAKGEPMPPPPSSSKERTTIQLRFEKKFRDKVVDFYLPHVMESAKEIKAEKKKVRLFSLGSFGNMDGRSGPWSSVDFDHPSTFETMAMEEKLKKMVMEDLDRFVDRKEFYRRVGKAWKRGYLLYGPPGTGKSSLVAAMANYLKFDVYDLQLSNLHGYSDLRQLLVTVPNKSIIVIEDIDCSFSQLENRDNAAADDAATKFMASKKPKNQMKLSGLLNFADGLWSSLGDERIIVFTTNYKDRLDTALLRPGRMDVHVHMSYLTPCGFRTLAFNYLKIKGHHLFRKIEERLKEVEVTPAEVAEQLIRSDKADIALGGLVEFLQRKKDEMMMNKSNEMIVTGTNVDDKSIGTCGGKEQSMGVQEECVGVEGVDKSNNKRKTDMMIKNEMRGSSLTIKRSRVDLPEGYL